MNLVFAFLIGFLCTFTHFQKREHEEIIGGHLVNPTAVKMLYLSNFLGNKLGFVFCGLVAYQLGLLSGGIALALLAIGFFAGGAAYRIFYPLSRCLGIISFAPISLMVVYQFMISGL